MKREAPSPSGLFWDFFVSFTLIYVKNIRLNPYFVIVLTNDFAFVINDWRTWEQHLYLDNWSDLLRFAGVWFIFITMSGLYA